MGNSCNPAFIAIGQRLGAEKFYDYLENFGMIGKTGIDMQGEADNTSLVWSRDWFTGPYGETSLATASFGQRFKRHPHPADHRRLRRHQRRPFDGSPMWCPTSPTRRVT